MKEKTLLLRAVRIDGVIYFDSEHKANGRGAYICKNKECFKKAYKGRQFERSLKAKTSEGFYGVLEQAVCEE